MFPVVTQACIALLTYHTFAYGWVELHFDYNQHCCLAHCKFLTGGVWYANGSAHLKRKKKAKLTANDRIVRA